MTTAERTPPRQLARIAPEQLSAELMRRLPLEFLKRQQAIPILLDQDEPAVALADPLNLRAYDAIVGILGRPCRRIVCPAGEIEQAISRCYYLSSTEEASYLTPDPREPGQPQDAHLAAVSSTVQTRAEDLLNIADKAPAIKLVNKVLFHAVRSRASDVHIEPYEHEVKIRFRVDGVLRNILTLPKSQVAPVLSRVKIMANLNIAEHRLPQDGQSRVSIGAELVDIRVSVVPTASGERIVLRLLDKGRGELKLEEIGFGRALLQTFRSLIGISHGIILITGPTGSGKSSTLAAIMNEVIAKRLVHIVTIEDPIEFLLTDGMAAVTQREVGADTTSFADALRNALRQDPDVIMVGENRDLPTMSTTVTAAETGHVVFTTLHTNSAPQTIDRVIDMFPAEQHRQVRQQLAEVLKAVISLQLVERADGKGMVAAVEVLRDSPRIGKLIREGNIGEIAEEIERSVSYYRMQSMNQSLAALVINNVVSKETAMEISGNPGDLDLMLRKFFFASQGSDAPGEEGSMPSNADYSRIHKLLEVEKLYDDLQERHRQDLTERDERITQLQAELRSRYEEDSERDAKAQQFEEERERMARGFDAQRAEYDAKIERLQARIRELTQAEPAPAGRGGGLFRR